MAMTSRRPNHYHYHHYHHHHRRPTIFEIIVGTIIVVTLTTCHNVGTGIGSCEALALALVTVRVARLPEDLKQIQECRRTAVYGDDCDSTSTSITTNNDNDEKPLLDSQRSFLNADQIQNKNGGGSYKCIIAVEEDTGLVVGTADLNVPRGLVNNVYVQDRIRGLGIGTRLMQGVEQELLVQRSNDTNDQNTQNQNQKPTTLRLTVETTNTPAVALYKRLGFQTPGVHALTAAISSATRLTLLIEMTKQLSPPDQVQV
eukprot:CAMPEP_0198288688 /NCGR_PEP_ID=MMETSP1449-20131203/7114_1 /TAXON_ID=420275 /ORGANISM="Attheya septentrionalis, Strain CCMP2084" /LENGTH=257 /DNA_ID=CAMNT_0043986885 /DNA_START=49 /DNA_END=822 /DNA_ORIENTATION=+